MCRQLASNIRVLSEGASGEEEEQNIKPAIVSVNNTILALVLEQIINSERWWGLPEVKRKVEKREKKKAL